MTANGHISNSGLRVLMAAGGTGGHVYPAIAIADALREQIGTVSILFAGTRDRMEWTAVPKAGYAISPIWISGFHRRLTLRNMLFPLKVLVSLVQSLALMIRFRPDLVIACGGFVSGPVGWVAARCGKRLVIQEQNSYPGVTNRMLAKDAEMIFTAFEDAADYFPAGKPIRLTGNPIRTSMQPGDAAEGRKTYGLDPSRPCVLVLGGSGGAREINDILLRKLPEILGRMKLQVIWQCGPAYIESVQSRLQAMINEGLLETESTKMQAEPAQEGTVAEHAHPVSASSIQGLHVSGYLKTIADAYRAADLVITRAGAGTCSELMVLGKPALLIPSPNVAGDHQTKNARSMVAQGAAAMLEESELDDRLVPTIEDLMQSPERLATLATAARSLAKPNAAREIAQECLRRLEGEQTPAQPEEHSQEQTPAQPEEHAQEQTPAQPEENTQEPKPGGGA